MPNVKIHERVGNYIGKKIGKNSYDYYLGLLAPDSPNVDGFAPKEERWMAHQRRKDYDEWREEITKFYDMEKKYYPEDFLLGYYIHVITDIVYDDYFYIPIRDEIVKEIPLEKSHEAMRKDMDNYYDTDLDTIKEILKSKNDSYDILNISKKELLRWKDKEINSWKSTDKCKYLTEEILKELDEKVYDEISKKLER